MRTLFEISKSGLRSAERSLSVTSNNVINADTPGYSRQRVDKSPIGMQLTGYHAGLGVNIDSVTRLRNEMTDVLINEKKQDMGYLSEKARIYEQLEAGMASDSMGDLDLRIGRLFDTFSELSADPQDFSVRNNVITEAIQLTDKLADTDRNLDRSSQQVKESAVKSVDSINNILRDLNTLNSAIKNGAAKGQPDHSSLDLQVKKLDELSELTNFEQQVSETGALEIRINGIKVLDENKATHIKPEINDVDKNFRLRLDNGKVINVTSGKLGAEIEMYEKEIPELKNRLDQIAETLVNEFNAIHSSGYGLEDNTARNFFNPDATTASDIKVNDFLITNQQHIAASTVPGEAGNGNIAADLADLRNEILVGGRKLVDFSVDLISTPGSLLSSVRSEVEARDSEINMLEIQQERESGVNIDEELSLMIQYQNAYQGSARVMQAAQQMYDTLISIV
ncbi:MAG: flagellar hook-associated protein FlgK [Balneolaceae bacterium]|nr:flagellar hook-associated protein FlgK [Balneolaceae bacterium]MCH8547295.1 flagellar hook-associated protein FlgK [Balneolaceae bacterium]